MQAVRLFHLVARWLFVLVEAGGMLWLLALFLALLGWAAWGAWGAWKALRRIRPAAEPGRGFHRLSSIEGKSLN